MRSPKPPEPDQENVRKFPPTRFPKLRNLGAKHGIKAVRSLKAVLVPQSAAAWKQSGRQDQLVTAHRETKPGFLSRPRNFGGSNEKSSLSRRHCDWLGSEFVGNDCGRPGRPPNSGSNKGSGSDAAGSERHQQGQGAATFSASLQQ